MSKTKAFNFILRIVSLPIIIAMLVFRDAVSLPFAIYLFLKNGADFTIYADGERATFRKLLNELKRENDMRQKLIDMNNAVDEAVKIDET
jgi:predicted membrane protein